MDEKFGHHHFGVSGISLKYGIYSSSKGEAVGREKGRRFEPRMKI